MEVLRTCPTCGYRRITALPDRPIRVHGAVPMKHKRVYRIMKAHKRLPARRYTERPELTHAGTVVTMHSDNRAGKVVVAFL